jgi:transposase
MNYGNVADRFGAMELNRTVRSPNSNPRTAALDASEKNLALDFKGLNLGPRGSDYRKNGGSNRNSKRLNSRKKLRKNRRANKTRRYRK